MLVKIVDINTDRIGLLRPFLIPDIQCKVGNILKENNIATAGNSFGFMDGGVDLAIASKYERVESNIRTLINNRPLRELLVGECMHTILPDGKNLLYAPTMRVPTILKDSVNIYLTMKAILIKAVDLKLEEISVPILGAGVGQLQAKVIATQINQAYKDVFVEYKQPNSWWESSVKHQQLYTSRIVDLQK